MGPSQTFSAVPSPSQTFSEVPSPSQTFSTMPSQTFSANGINVVITPLSEVPVTNFTTTNDAISTESMTGRTRLIQIKSGRAIVPPALPVPTVLVKNQKTKDIGIFENKITWLPNKVEMLIKQKLNKLQNKSMFWKRKTSFYLTKLKSSSLNHPCSRRCWKNMNLRFKQCNITFIMCVIILISYYHIIFSTIMICSNKK